MDVYTTFNGLLLDLFRHLAIHHPHVEGFRQAYASIKLLSTLNAMAVAPMFNKYIHAYIPMILGRDESFFLEKNDYDINHVDKLDIVRQIKDIWRGLSQDQKDDIWVRLETILRAHRQIEISNHAKSA